MPRNLFINFATNAQESTCPHITYKTTGRGPSIKSISIMLDINTCYFPQDVQQHLLDLIDVYKRLPTAHHRLHPMYCMHINTKITASISDFYKLPTILTHNLSFLELSIPNHRPLDNLLYINNLPYLKTLHVQCYSHQPKRLFIQQLPQLQILEITQNEVATRTILDYHLSFTLIRLYYHCQYHQPADDLLTFDQPTKVNWLKLTDITYKNPGLNNTSTIIDCLFNCQHSDNQLRHLDLLINNEYLYLPKLPNLEYLSIASIKHLNGLTNAIDSLSYLDLCNIENLDDLHLNLTNLTNLTKICLTYLPIVQCSIDCPSLKCMRINYCRDLTDLVILQADCLDLEIHGCLKLALFDIVPTNCLQSLCVHRSHLNYLDILQKQYSLCKLRLDHIPLPPCLILQSSLLEELFINNDTKDNNLGLTHIYLLDMPKLNRVCFKDLYQLQELRIYNAPQLTICSLFDCPNMTNVYIEKTPRLFEFDIRYAGCTIRQGRIELHH